ncbi:MAG: nucleotide exchange factor GrpE [Chloroflexota bacterium]
MDYQFGHRRGGRVREDDDDVAELRAQLAEARQKSDEYVNLAQRLQADFLNYKRRVEQEREEQAKNAQSRLMLKLLPVLDDLDRAMDSVRAELAGLHWVQGVGHINRKLQSVLESEGLEQVEANGHAFDPRQHEAVVYEEAGRENDGRVLSVLQKGYKLHDRVIRPAMVKVGKGSPSHRAPAEEHHTGASFVEED